MIDAFDIGTVFIPHEVTEVVACVEFPSRLRGSLDHAIAAVAVLALILITPVDRVLRLMYGRLAVVVVRV